MTEWTGFFGISYLILIVLSIDTNEISKTAFKNLNSTAGLNEKNYYWKNWHLVLKSNCKLMSSITTLFKMLLRSIATMQMDWMFVGQTVSQPKLSSNEDYSLFLLLLHLQSKELKRMISIGYFYFKWDYDYYIVLLKINIQIFSNDISINSQ